VTALNEVLRRVEDGVDVAGLHIKTATGMSAAVLGIALILTLRLRPAGLLSSYEFQFGLGAGSGTSGVSAPESEER